MKKEKKTLGYKANYAKINGRCAFCGHEKFFIDTMGIEHCSKCSNPTGSLK